jgi:hypothetical protein
MNQTYADSSYELCNYLADDYIRHCTGVAFSTLEATKTTVRSLDRALRPAHTSVIYADGPMIEDPRFQGLLSSRSSRWRRIAHGTGSDGPWSIIVPPSDGGPK